MKKSTRPVYVAAILTSIAAASTAGNMYGVFPNSPATNCVTNSPTSSAFTTADLNGDETEASKENPVDMSDKIVNATFDTKGDVSGWTLTHNNGSNHAEVKNGVVTGRAYFDLRQTIQGLEPGLYKVTAQVFTRPDENDKVWTAVKNGETLINKTYLYAGNNRVLCPLITSEGCATSQSGWTELEGLGYVPNSSGQVASAFAMGMYKVEVEAIVGSNGELTFGVTNEYDEWANYAGADNFKLYYLGAVADISEADAATLIASAPTGKMEAAIQTAMDSAIEALKANRNAETYDAASVAINAAKRSAETYALVKDALDKAEGEKLSDDARKQYEEAVKDIVTGYETGTLSGTCETEINAIEEALKAAKILDAEQSNDLTSLIANPQFDEGKSGWSGDFGNGAKKGTADNYVITCFGSGFDIYQTLTGLKPGTYKLKAQAFSRPTDNASVWNDVQDGKGVTNETYIYANKKELKVPLIVDDYETAKPASGTWSSHTKDGKTVYVPNDSKAFSVAFSDGLYENEMLCYVGEDGKLTFGIKNLDGSNASTYAGYDNFRLSYVSSEMIEEDPDKMTRADTLAKANAYNTIAAQATEHAAFDDVYTAAIAKMEATDADPKDVEKAYDDIVAAFNDLVKTATTATGQFDFTPLISNADFAKNADGWQQPDNNIRWNSIGTMIGSDIKAGARLSQVLKNMPAGNYTLKMQGFYRPQGWKQALYDYEHGAGEQNLHLFLGDAQTNVKSIFDDARNLLASACISRKEDVGATIDGRGYPLLNDSKITEAFAPGAYWNCVNATISKDGDISLGIELDATTLSDNWLTADNFRLYYGTPKTVTLQEGQTYSQTDDKSCNVIIRKKFTAGTLNPFSAPCDIPGDRFEAVYEIGAIDVSTKTAYVYPVEKVHAGTPCYVEVASDMDSVIVGPTILKAATPDRLPFIWSGGAHYAVYNNFGWRATPNKSATLSHSFFTNVEKQSLTDLNFTADIENLQTKRFLTTDYSAESATSVVGDYNKPVPARRDLPHAIGIPVPESLSKGAVLRYGTDETLSQAQTIEVTEGASVCYIPNLIPGNKYYAEVHAATGDLLVKAEFDVTGQLRFVYAPSVYNLRDLGGWEVSDSSTIRYGLIYRGGEVNGSHPAIEADLATLKALGIGAEVDLRYNDTYDMDRETNKSGYGFVHGDTYYFAGSNWYTADHIADANCQKQLAEEFRFILKNIREGRGVHFHCTFGADRTGFLAVLIEGVLGMNLNQMCHDYELTSFAAPAGNRNKQTIINIINAVKTNSKGTKLRDRFENYWIEKCKVTREEIDELRAIMLVKKSYPTGVRETAPADGTAVIQHVYTLAGTEISQSVLSARQKGVYIIQYSDGTTRKVIVR